MITMPWEASRIQAENLSKSMSPKKKRLVDDIYHPPHSERLVCLGTIFVSEISIHAFHLTKILPRIFVETSGPQFWCKNLSHPPLSAATSGGREVGSTPKVTDFGKTNYCHIKGQSDYSEQMKSPQLSWGILFPMELRTSTCPESHLNIF